MKLCVTDRIHLYEMFWKSVGCGKVPHISTYLHLKLSKATIEVNLPPVCDKPHQKEAVHWIFKEVGIDREGPFGPEVGKDALPQGRLQPPEGREGNFPL